MLQSHTFPIGIFDSGVGGTSIWKEINTLLPLENTIYLSDSKNAPYGEKSKQAIIDLSIKNTEFLLNKNCKMIVVACNTATTNAIKILREKYDIPFIGIEPAIKPAALKTKTKTIGILATKGTLNSDLFEKTSNTINQKIIRKEIIGTGLVALIERGKLHSNE
ncbi:MAG: glutamate racemase, partial [Polaribacter sp.]|nr:glutamate racemase [Polaribacter sp.]